MPAEGAPRDPVRLGLLAGALVCLLLVGLAHPSVAAPPLGPPGWVPHVPGLPADGWGVVALQTAGYVLGGAALVRAVRRPSRLGLTWPVWVLVGGLTLLTVPFGTADHTNYAAYGHILAEGGDPWLTSPQDYGPDPVTSLVQPPWRDTPDVYGPVATGVLGVAAHLGGESVRQIVWLWQVVLVAAWLATRWLLVRLVGDREAVDTWWTGNVLVLGAGVLGAHVDLLATALLVAALLVGTRVPGVLGGGLAGAVGGLALSTKATAGVVLLVLVLPLVRRIPDDPYMRFFAPAPREVAVVVGALASAVPLHLWAGPHVLEQVSEQGSGGVSYASPWRAVYTLLDLAVPEPVARSLATTAAGVFCVVLAVVLWRRLGRPKDPPHLLLVLTTAYAVGAAYVLPWYALPMWAAVAVTVGASTSLGGPSERAGNTRLLLALAVQGTVMALGYVPGRVGLPEPMETVTLAWRMVVVPLVTLRLWVWLLRDATRAARATCARQG